MSVNAHKWTCVRLTHGPRGQTSILRRLLTIRMSTRTTPLQIRAQFQYISLIRYFKNIEFLRSECQQDLPASLKVSLSNQGIILMIFIKPRLSRRDSEPHTRESRSQVISWHCIVSSFSAFVTRILRGCFLEVGSVCVLFRLFWISLQSFRNVLFDILITSKEASTLAMF